jgi:uncharacterized protein (TIGR04255 family)
LKYRTDRMSFPRSPRVLYGRNPLDLVISQLRFPPILKIEAELPYAFQDAVRTRYPNFRTTRQADVFPEALRHLVVGAGMGMPGGSISHDFSSADGCWTVSLTREAISLSNAKYTRWEEFREHFRFVLGILEKHYSPASYSRIGLRYRDVIRRANLGLAETPWAALLNPYIAGELGAPELDGIQYASHDFAIPLEGGVNGSVRVQHGLGRELPDGKAVYFIDSDFFTDERTEIANALEVLDAFNGRAGDLFRWCITPDLHRAMDPVPI